MITSYDGIETLSDDLVDMWGDGSQTKNVTKKAEAEQAPIEKIKGPTKIPRFRKIVTDNLLDTHPYYVYKYYMEVVRELVADMGFNRTEREIRQIARNIWPKYSDKLDIVREARVRYVQDRKEAKETQRDELNDTARLSRRMFKTGTWGKILDETTTGNSSTVDINAEPYYIYKYFMNIVREQCRGMGLKHSKEEIQQMGIKLWPTFMYKNFLASRALAQYRYELKNHSKPKETTTETGKVNEGTQTEFQEPPKTKKHKLTKRSDQSNGKKKV